MPRITHQLIVLKGSGICDNDFALSHNAHLVCRGVHGNGLASKTGRYAIAVTIHFDQAICST